MSDTASTSAPPNSSTRTRVIEETEFGNNVEFWTSTTQGFQQQDHPQTSVLLVALGLTLERFAASPDGSLG